MTHIFDPRSEASWGEWVNLMPPDYGTTLIPPVPVPVNKGVTPDPFPIREEKELGSQEMNRKNAEIATLRDYIDQLENGV